MFKNPKVRVYLTLFLLFSVASSKAIIIYNEETLVALSFLTFVMFSFSYFGNMVKESLDERSDLIRFSLENFHRLKEEALKELLSQHKQIEELKKLYPSLISFTENQLSYASVSGDQKISLHNRFCSQIQQKIGLFQSSKTLLQQRLQKNIALTIPTLVIAKIRHDNQQDISKGGVEKQSVDNQALDIRTKSQVSNKNISAQVKESLKLLKS